MRIEYHRTLIADRARVAAFKEALSRVIEPGVTTVADIGAGTGLLGLIAARLGAREVFLYETAEVAAVAEKVLKQNRARNCHLIPCHSLDMQDPPRVDVVVSETLGNYAFEEDMIATLADAARRFLKPGGHLVPRRVTQWVAPVIASRLHDELAAWDDVEPGIDLGVARDMTFNNVYVRSLSPIELHQPDGCQWDEVTFSPSSRSNRKGEANWRLPKRTTVFGFAVWWQAELLPGVTLSTAPTAPPTHWEQLYFPLATPLACAAGETLNVSLRSRTSRETGTHLAWTAVRAASNGKLLERRAHDLEKGYLP